MVIDESPAVGLQENNMALNATLEHHLMVESELIRRDKNRAAAIIWSVANEPQSNYPVATSYFQQVISHVRALDSTRPVTFVSCQDYNTDVAVQFNDVIFINKYFGWYVQTGELDTIKHDLSADITGWLNAFPGKPVGMSEYGADTVPGLHTLPSFVFTEDYQSQFYALHAQVFDSFRTAPQSRWFSELTWCFADFMTGQTDVRVVGNKKGLLTRDREPKAAAIQLAARYNQLAANSPQCPPTLGELVENGCRSTLGVHVTPAIPAEFTGTFSLHQSEVAIVKDTAPAPASASVSATAGDDEDAFLLSRIDAIYARGLLSAEEKQALEARLRA
jgi:beta-glucuronidase